MNISRIAVLEERVAHFHETIAAFERMRATMLERRRGSADHVMVEIDERLAVNARSLKCFKRSLELVEAELRGERAKASAAPAPEALDR